MRFRALFAAVVVAGLLAWVLWRPGGERAVATPVERGAASEASPPARLAGTPAPVPEADASDATETSDAVPDRLAAPALLDVRILGPMRRPLRDARVALRRSYGEDELAVETTDRDGRCRFPAVTHPEVSVTASCAGYAAGGTPMLTLGSGERRDVEVELDPALVLRGRVVDAATGAGLPGAKVFARTCALRELYREEEIGETFWTTKPAVTGDDGAFVLEGLDTHALYGAWVEVDGYERGERELRFVGPVEGPGAEFRLARVGRVRAVVRNARGEPQEGVRVSLVPADEPDDAEPRERPLVWSGSWFGPSSTPIHSAVTDASGTAVVGGLRLGRTYDVDRAVPLDRASQDVLAPSEPLTPTEAQPETVVDLRLEPPATLRLHFTPFKSGDEIVRVSIDGDKGSVGQQFSGVVEVTGLPPGAVTAEATLKGFLPVRIATTVRSGGTTEEEVRFSEGARVRGRVTDMDGRPVAGVWIQVDDDSWPWTVETDGDGRFGIVGLAPGKHTLDVGSPDAATRHLDFTAPADDLRVMLDRESRGHVTARLPAGISNAWFEERLRRPSLSEFGPFGYLRLGGRTEPSEHRGQLVLWNADPGDYCVVVPSGGALLQVASFRIAAGQRLDLGTLAVPAGPPVAVRVEFPDGGAVAGAHVELVGFADFDTDDRGRFELPAAPPGPVTAVVTPHRSPETRLDVRPPPPGQPWTIVAGQGGRLEGRVEAAASTAGLRVRVDAVREEPKEGTEATEGARLDSAGRFVFQRAPGGYRVSLRRGAETLDTATVEVREGEMTRVTLRAR